MAARVIDTRSHDLWRTAADGLSSTLRGMIEMDSDGENRMAALETVLYHANHKRKECVSKQWKVKNRNGDIIILRDVYEKIFKWVDGFRVVGDAVSPHLPAEAAIPWGGGELRACLDISFLIRLAKGQRPTKLRGRLKTRFVKVGKGNTSCTQLGQQHCGFSTDPRCCTGDGVNPTFDGIQHVRFMSRTDVL